MVRGEGTPFCLLPGEKVPWWARCPRPKAASRAPRRMRGKRQRNTSSDTADAVPPSPKGEGKGPAHRRAAAARPLPFALPFEHLSPQFLPGQAPNWVLESAVTLSAEGHGLSEGLAHRRVQDAGNLSLHLC